MSDMESIKKIREAMDTNKLVVFVGAGVSMNSQLPSWSDLIKRFAISMGIDSKKEFNSEDYLRIAQYYYNQRGKKEYYDEINKAFNISLNPNLIHDYILRMLPHHIVTTNYDNLLEQAIENNILFYDAVCQDSDLPYTPNGRLLIKMHGDYKLKNIVLKEDDYLMYSNNFRLIQTFVKSLFANYLVLFVGYSLQDYNLKSIIRSVREILGEHFQKAYLVDSIEKERSDVEVDYFRNMGVKVISKKDIPYQYQTIEVPELKSEHGKNVIRIIRSMLDYENNSISIIEYYYEKLKVFKDLMKIRLSDFINILGISSHYEKGKNNIKIFNLSEEDKFYILLKSLNEFATLQNSENNMANTSDFREKYNYINKILLRTGIQEIEIVNYTETSKETKIKYVVDKKTIETKLPIINFIENNNFIEIELLAKQSFKRVNMHENKHFNELIRAYANYLVNRFVSAYKILGKISKEAYKDREYIAFFISEYNRRYLMKKIKRISGTSRIPFVPLDIGESIYADEIKELIKEYDSSNFNLRDIYFLMPKKERDSIEFLNDIVFDDGFVYSRIAAINKLKKKVESEVTTRFSGMDPLDGGIAEIKDEVYSFWQYTNQNFILIDGYQEIRDYYYNFIISLFNTYSKEKEKEKEDIDSTLFPLEFTEIMPNYKFNILDIFIINKYIDNNKLKELISQYDINEIEVCIPNIALRGLFINLVSSYMTVDYRQTIKEMIKNLLVFASKVRLDSDDLKEIIDSFTKMIIAKPVDNEIYRALLYFIINQNKFDSEINEHLNNLIIAFVKKITNVEFNRQNGGFEIEAITQYSFIDVLSQYVKKDKFVFDDSILETVIKSIEGGELRKYKRIIIEEVLIPLSSLLNENDYFSNKFKDIIINELASNFSITLYEHACKRELIIPNQQFEEKIWDRINLEIESKKARESKKESILPDPLERILGQVANMVYLNLIQDKEKLKEYLGYIDIYDLIVCMEEFDYCNKFKVNWLSRFDKDLIQKICSIDSAKFVIKEKLEQEIIKNNDLDIRVKEIYFKWFR